MENVDSYFEFFEKKEQKSKENEEKRRKKEVETEYRSQEPEFEILLNNPRQSALNRAKSGVKRDLVR